MRPPEEMATGASGLPEELLAESHRCSGTEPPATAATRRQAPLRNLVKNNLVLDLKQTEAEIYLFGPGAGDLVKNNLIGSQVLIFQPVTSAGAILEENNVMV